MNGDHRDRFYTPSGQKVTELEKLLFEVAGRSGKRSHGIDLIEEQLLLRGLCLASRLRWLNLPVNIPVC